MRHTLNAIGINLAQEPNIDIKALGLLATKDENLVGGLQQSASSGVVTDKVLALHTNTDPLGHLYRL